VEITVKIYAELMVKIIKHFSCPRFGCSCRQVSIDFDSKMLGVCLFRTTILEVNTGLFAHTLRNCALCAHAMIAYAFLQHSSSAVDHRTAAQCATPSSHLPRNRHICDASLPKMDQPKRGVNCQAVLAGWAKVLSENTGGDGASFVASGLIKDLKSGGEAPNLMTAPVEGFLRR
jgi:hypothetical protein